MVWVMIPINVSASATFFSSTLIVNSHVASKNVMYRTLSGFFLYSLSDTCNRWSLLPGKLINARAIKEQKTLGKK